MYAGCRYYLFLYSHWLAPPLRDVISQAGTHCDVILLNFLVSHVTRRPPINVAGRLTSSRTLRPISVASSGRHGNAAAIQSWVMKARQYCMGRLTEQLGYMPLIRSAVRFEPLLHHDAVSVLRKKYRQMENVASL